MTHRVGWFEISDDAWAMAAEEIRAMYPGEQVDERSIERTLEDVLRWSPTMYGVTYAVPVRYVTAGGRDILEVEAYLGFGAHIIHLSTRPRGHVVCTIEIPAEHADWLSGRLNSGLLGGMIHDEKADALAEEIRRSVI